MRGMGVCFLIWSASLMAALQCPAQIVINELFYHAPNELEGLDYIELHNPGSEPADLSGWKLAKGIQYQFPAGTKLEAKGFLVVCQNLERFQQFYGLAASGAFVQALSKKGERIELLNAQGKKIDGVKYRDHAPWPTAPDGSSASLERICPTADSDLPQNWVGSPLSEDPSKPGGTPGRQNANFSENLPPIIKNVTFTPTRPAPGQTLEVEADVNDADGVQAVTLRYRTAGSGSEAPESMVPMRKLSKHRYAASLPGQKAGLLLRFRIEARDAKGSRRLFPAETEPRPAFSCYIHDPIPPARIPQGCVINVGEAEFKTAQAAPCRTCSAYIPAGKRVRSIFSTALVFTTISLPSGS